MTKNAMFNLRDYTTADILNTPVRRGGILPVTEYPDRTEFDISSGLTGALMDAFTAPARAARGEISEAEQIPEAFNFAGSLTLGSLLAPRPTGSVGMGGRAAKEALEAQQPQGIRAFHGSPHDFDRFSMDAIGTGEGAQAYGHGLYFAEAEDVAKTYRSPNPPSRMINSLVAKAQQGGLSFDDFMKTVNPAFRNEFQLAWDAALGRGGPGHMYEVNIKADPQDFLDWDKPRDGLAPKVQEWIKANHPDVWDKAADGSSLYQHLQNKLPDASQSLREAGIPGIRYLDQMSRGEGKGSSNYVVFDDNLIEILRKYGLLPPVAAGGLAAALGQEDELY